MTRQLLLDAGVEVMTEKGYGATTIDQIALAAGATRATFYLHFTSKAELVRFIVERADEMLTSADRPPLPEMVASNDPGTIRAYLSRKFDQWPDIKPYMMISLQAAAADPEIQSALDAWHDRAIGAMASGLDSADRFDPSSRRVRCAIAFGQLIFMSQRWFRLGWAVDREELLDQMTASWTGLLCTLD
ncbi:helix-turn-helix domain-containing protein [Citricoccus sp. NPDC079358]|uniref:TetR/AcrR family transcriptional regulator n=1 Tax=Citricoccus sp. NPDC079358 TaxID=3154653 RepID=UPI00344D7793